MIREIVFTRFNYSKSSTPVSNDLHPVQVDVPDICPACHYHIAPVILPSYYLHDSSNDFLYVAVLQCQHCFKLFIAYYNGVMSKPIDIVPKTPEFRTFDDSISKLSPNFVATYNQSLAAECMDLTEIAGMGFRKAIEYLIKDYLIMRLPDKSDSIRSEFLGSCISNYVDNVRLKTVASRAVWLGNDFTHYTRKYEEYDILDLKKFIEASVHWIQMELLTDEAENMDHR